MKQNPIMKSFLLEWLILHGDSWLFYHEMSKLDKDIVLVAMARNSKYLEEEDQFPVDKHRWGSYYRLTKKGRKYATL